MKKGEKRLILILALITIAVISVFMLVKKVYFSNKVNKENIVQVLNDGTKVNVSGKLNEIKQIEGFTIQNVKFLEKNGITELRADVTNRTSKPKEGFLMDIVLYDKDGKEIGRIPGNVLPTNAGETIEICAGITGITDSYVNAYDFKMVKK